ncbi:NADP-dependent oxidoreductase [Streptomyces sp. NBC_01622]|uniref:NADP-dependent oxidoreductase n=1 Tax=Streptomyces sp. NBC_01622 TaxID=2975903 RepID=UPI00387027A0|nr:NADP-dependent oxidoreductase [Streptomyces sp. NBC_01622]
MKAITYEKFGGPEVLRLAQVDEPHAGPGQVRIQVRAAGVNPMDHKIRNGWLAEVFPTTFPAIPGNEASGVVDEVGEGVTGVAVGDEVFGLIAGGAYAEQAIASVFARKPSGLGWAEAAALPVAALTAARDLDLLGVTADDTLLIHGAAGGVGTVAVQMGVARGATVIGTASAANHEYLRSLGAVPLAYGEGLVSRVRDIAPHGVDAVYDIAGQGALPDSIELRGGTTDRIVTIADPAGAGLGIPLSTARATDGDRILAEAAQMAIDGKLKIVITTDLPLADAAMAMAQSETGHVQGKIVVHP